MLVAVIWGKLREHRCTSFIKVGQALSCRSVPQLSLGGFRYHSSRTRTAQNRSNYVSSAGVYKLHRLSSTSHTSLVGDNSSKPFAPLGL